MKDRGIRISPKHGVNPSLLSCFICGGDAGLALLGLLPGDAEAPRQMALPRVFCRDCEEKIKEGVVWMIETRDRDENPYRTGRLWGVTQKFARRLLHLAEDAPTPPAMFIIEADARAIGLHAADEAEEGAVE